MQQELAFREPLEFVPLNLICLRFVSLTKKYQDCKAVQGSCSVPMWRKETFKCQGSRHGEAAKRQANRGSAGPASHGVSCNTRVVGKPLTSKLLEGILDMCLLKASLHFLHILCIFVYSHHGGLHSKLQGQRFLGLFVYRGYLDGASHR